MRGINSVFIVGRAGQDPELRRSQGGVPWCSLAVATHRRVRGEGGEWIEETDWHDVRLFGAHAEQCEQTVARGCRVAVEGSLTYDLWVDDDGNRRRSPRILASSLSVVGRPSPRAVALAAAPSQPPLPAKPAPELEPPPSPPSPSAA